MRHMNLRVFSAVAALLILGAACGGNTDDPNADCGDGVCAGAETSQSCPSDCAASSCGDGSCAAGETAASCPSDCGSGSCGNGTCDTDVGEDSSSCPADCGGGGAVCGNGTCETGEDAVSCVADCGPVCGNGTCESGETESSCAADCGSGPVCGNGTCEAGETTTSCADDCGAPAVCGNGSCEPTENPTTCAADCTFECSSIPTATNIGGTCQSEADCGGGICVDLGQGATCYQGCVPGLCTDTCTGTEVCLTLMDQSGNPLELQPGVNAGACGEQPTGDAAIYDACGAVACQAGLACGAMQNLPAYGAMCFGSCQTDADCPEREGVAGRCVLNDGAGNQSCALVCTSGDNSTCPTGMECADLGGGAICLWPK